MARRDYPHTPDGHYFVAKSRLWRCTDPSLEDSVRRARIKELMRARNAVRLAADELETREARQAVHAAKLALGERGEPWWGDDGPVVDGKHPKNTIYAEWWASLAPEEQAAGTGSDRR